MNLFPFTNFRFLVAAVLPVNTLCIKGCYATQRTILVAELSQARVYVRSLSEIAVQIQPGA
jgi:hypothetical protein